MEFLGCGRCHRDRHLHFHLLGHCLGYRRGHRQNVIITLPLSLIFAKSRANMSFMMCSPHTVSVTSQPRREVESSLVQKKKNWI